MHKIHLHLAVDQLLIQVDIVPIIASSNWLLQKWVCNILLNYEVLEWMTSMIGLSHKRTPQCVICDSNLLIIPHLHLPSPFPAIKNVRTRLVPCLLTSIRLRGIVPWLSTECHYFLMSCFCVWSGHFTTGIIGTVKRTSLLLLQLLVIRITYKISKCTLSKKQIDTR